MSLALLQQNNGGGSAITDPGVAYVRSDGNDSTGDGTPAKPFLTFTSAMNHANNYVSFDFGVGSFGGCNIDNAPRVGDISITVRGRGYALTNCASGPVTATGRNLTIKDVGVRSVQFSQINVAGSPGGSLLVEDVYLTDLLTAQGANDPGAAAGSVTVLGACQIASGIACGGLAGADGTGVDPGGDGGAGGNVFIVGPSLITGSIQTSGGAGGSDGGAGAGSAGADGHLAASQGASIPTPTVGSDTPTYIGVIVNGIFIVNAIPCADSTTAPIVSVTTVSGVITVKA